MKRHLPSIARWLLITVLLNAACALAQSKSRVYIPFAFTVNRLTLPAGHYELQLLSDRFLCFSNSRTGEHLAAIMVQPEPARYIETRGRARFVSSGARHYLIEVQFAGSSMHSRPVLSRSLERELAQNPRPDSSLEIAMNK